MKIRNHVLILDISKNTEQVSVNLGAGDTSNRLIVKLYENGSQKELDDCSAVFSMPRGGSSASDYTILEGCTTVGDQIEYVFSAAAVSMVGSFPSTIIVYDDEGNIMYTPSVRINVRETPYDDAKVSASGSYTALTGMKSQIESSISTLNGIANSFGASAIVGYMKEAGWNMEFDYQTRKMSLFLDGTKVAEVVVPVPTAEQVLGKTNIDRFETMIGSLIYNSENDYNEANGINASLDSQVPVVGSVVDITLKLDGCTAVYKNTEYEDGDTIKVVYNDHFYLDIIPEDEGNVVEYVSATESQANIYYFTNRSYRASLYVDRITKEFTVTAKAEEIECTGLMVTSANVTAKNGTTLNTLYGGYFKVKAGMNGMEDLKELLTSEFTVKYAASIGPYSKGDTFVSVQAGINQLEIEYKSQKVLLFVNGVSSDTTPDSAGTYTLKLKLEYCNAQYNGSNYSVGESSLSVKKGDMVQIMINPTDSAYTVYDIVSTDTSAMVSYYEGDNKKSGYVAISNIQGNVTITAKAKSCSLASIYTNVYTVAARVGVTYASLIDNGSVIVKAKYNSMPEDKTLTSADVTFYNAEEENGSAITNVSTSVQLVRIKYGAQTCDIMINYRQ